MCEHAHVQNLPALIVYVDRQGEQPPARGMDDPTCRDVPADGRRGVPAQLSRGAHPRPRPMFQNRWNVPITLRAKSSRKRNTPPPNLPHLSTLRGDLPLLLLPISERTLPPLLSTVQQ